MGVNTNWAANFHDSKKYAENRDVKNIHHELLKGLETSTSSKETLESFSRALDALDNIGRRTLEHLAVSSSAQFHGKSPFVAEEILWIVSHPLAQPLLAIREQERFFKCMNHRVLPEETQDCYQTLQDRIAEIQAAQWAHCKGGKDCYAMVEGHRAQAFQKYCPVSPPRRIDPYAALTKEGAQKMVEAQKTAGALNKGKEEAEKTVESLRKAKEDVQRATSALKEIKEDAEKAVDVLRREKEKDEKTAEDRERIGK